MKAHTGRGKNGAKERRSDAPPPVPPPHVQWPPATPAPQPASRRDARWLEPARAWDKKRNCRGTAACAQAPASRFASRRDGTRVAHLTRAVRAPAVRRRVQQSAASVVGLQAAPLLSAGTAPWGAHLFLQGLDALLRAHAAGGGGLGALGEHLDSHNRRRQCLLLGERAGRALGRRVARRKQAPARRRAGARGAQRERPGDGRRRRTGLPGRRGRASAATRGGAPRPRGRA